MTLSIACLQLCSTPDVDANLVQIDRLARQAAAGGARFIAVPEAADFIGEDGDAFRRHAMTVGGRVRTHLANLARELECWFLAGSLTTMSDGRIVNRAHLFTDTGAEVATYDKIHLFDVTLPNGEAYRESDIYDAGSEAVIVTTPWGPVGFTICYDLRFPMLYRRLAQAGAKILFVPAAFTPMTGQLHWEPLLRTRAIETGCHIVAPAQCGLHIGDRRSHGHSMIVDPWGRIIAEGGDVPAMIAATIDLDETDRYRAAIPATMLERAFSITS